MKDKILCDESVMGIIKMTLINNCIGYDDSLKREKHTCYTIQKKAFEGKYYKEVKNTFKSLGVTPKVQSEDDDFITYMVPY